jgi:hypothetical protein
MSNVLEGMLDTEIYPTDDGLLAIEQADDIVVLLSVDQLLTVINELRVYYDARAQWQEATRLRSQPAEAIRSERLGSPAASL